VSERRAAQRACAQADGHRSGSARMRPNTTPPNGAPSPFRITPRPPPGSPEHRRAASAGSGPDLGSRSRPAPPPRTSNALKDYSGNLSPSRRMQPGTASAVSGIPGGSELPAARPRQKVRCHLRQGNTGNTNHSLAAKNPLVPARYNLLLALRKQQKQCWLPPTMPWQPEDHHPG
jgi:hypothetical protein